MREFNLEEAKKGAKVCTRDGHKAKIVRSNSCDIYPIKAVIELSNELKILADYAIDGAYIAFNMPNDWDLMMEE